MWKRINDLTFLILIFAVSVVSIILIQQQVLAQWVDPTSNPTDSYEVGITLNPMQKPLDVNGYTITDSFLASSGKQGIVSATSSVQFTSAIYGASTNSAGYGLWGVNTAGTADEAIDGVAGLFEGDINISDGDLCFNGTDCINDWSSIAGLWSATTPINIGDGRMIERIYNTAEDNGFVGIGDSAPTHSLSLKSLYSSVHNYNAEITLHSLNSTANNQYWGVYHDRTSNDLRFWSDPVPGDKNLLKLTQAGQVAINLPDVSTPGAALEVRNPNSTGDILDLRDGADLVMTVKDGGNVGIGTDTPAVKLAINGGLARSTAYVYGRPASVDWDTHINLGSGYSIVGSTTQDARYCTVSGGLQNQATAEYSTIIGGNRNTASGLKSTVLGGMLNEATGEATVVAGYVNRATANYSTVMGGMRNAAIGANSIVLGGAYNTSTGAYSLAAGYYAQANHSGSFVWSDSSSATAYNSNANNTFNVRATGGVYFNSGSGSVPWDVAEFMDILSADHIQAAEIVSLKQDDKLGATSGAYDPNIIGVISGERTTTLHLGSTEPTYNDTVKMSVGLVGRVFVKVNNSNGQIAIGDPITSSEIAGVGMKATKMGKIIGYAMEAENFTKSNTSEILVFVNVGYYLPEDQADRLDRLEKEIQELKK